MNSSGFVGRWATCRCAVRVCILAFTIVMLPIQSDAQQIRIPEATTGGVRVSMPPDPKDSQGFSCSLTWAQPNEAGYHPVTIGLLPSGKSFTADKRVHVRIEPLEGGHSPQTNCVAVDLPITAGQGSTGEEVVRYIPKWTVGNGYQIRVFLDGVELPRYATQMGQMLPLNQGLPRAVLRRELVVDGLLVTGTTDLAFPFAQAIHWSTAGMVDKFVSRIGRWNQTTLPPGNAANIVRENQSR